MRNFYYSVIFIFLFSLAGFAQTPTPTPSPASVQNDDDVVKISTALIQVDATVTDKDGKIVTDLKPEEFQVFENDQKQDITNFSFISNVTETKIQSTPPPKSADKNASSIPLPPVNLRPEQIHRTIALVVDDLGLSFESIYFVRRSLKKFVDEQMQPNDLVAIVRTGSGAGALQQFTSDKNQLYASINSLKWNSLGRSGVSAFAPVEATPLEQSGASQDDIDADNQTTKNFDDFREDIFSVGTLGAINFIVKGMKELPGRKSIMLFSDGFVICTQDDPDRCTRIKDSVKELTDLCNRASVSIYSFDARGLQYTGLTAADNTSSLNSQQIQSRMTQRNNDLLDKQEGLAFLADQTGGRSFFNNNDFNKSLDKALEDQKGYYLIGYQPDADTFDPKTRRFNKLSIKVTRPGVKVRYRSGFFGVTDKAEPVAMTPAQQIQTALFSPFAISGVSLKLNTLFGNDEKLGPFVHSFLHINAKDLKFTDEPDGTHKAKFDVLAVSFGENGAPVDQIGKTYTLTVQKDSYQNILNEGFVYNFVFPIKKPGAYQMRVALRDSDSAKIGSANQFIEVPDLTKGMLTLSGIVLENFTEQQWLDLGKKSNPNDAATPPPGSGAAANPPETAADGEKTSTNPMADTSLRQFKGNTVLRYTMEIYNAKLDQGQKPQLQTQLRVFRDGKMILDGTPKPLNITGQTNMQKLFITGAISLGKTMSPGDYVLQMVVTDALAKDKNKLATQWVQFEIVE